MGIEHKKHVFRVFILLGVVVVGALIGRLLLVPESFGRYGFWRADSIAEQVAREVRHGGDEACAECHDDVKATHDAGPHLAVPCEDCHDALRSHVREGEDEPYAEMPRITSITHLCARCHRELGARPASFPQVNIKTHPVEMGAEAATDEVCFDCHSPHDPTP